MVKKLAAHMKPELINNLCHLVNRCAENFGDKVLYYYRDKPGDKDTKTFTYRDNLEHMNYLGTAFSVLGIMGNNIAVIGDTHPHYITAYFAAVNGGGCAVPLDKELGDSEIINFVNLAEVSVVVYTASFNHRLINYSDQMPNVKYFIPINDDDEDCTHQKVCTFTSLLSLGKTSLESGNHDFTEHIIDVEKMCTILFTSGTTGTSKGVMLCQRNLTAATNAAVMSMEYDDTNTFVSVLPMNHSYEITCGHLAIQDIGASVYINDSLKNALRSFNSFKPNALMLVPLFVETMYKKIWSEIDKKGMRSKVKAAIRISNLLLRIGVDVRDKFFSQITSAVGGNLRSIVCGGAPIAPQLIKDFHSFGIFVLEGYGITECSPLVAVNCPGKVRYHSVGQPVWGCEVKIDRSEGAETGEILVRGENVMLGYYKNEQATREVFTDDGWFRTGDIGYMDSDGYIFITGRKKNVIILSNGKNVFPEELEEYLSRSSLILESVVLGRSKNGDTVITAVIYPDFEKLGNHSGDFESKEVYDKIYSEVTAINKTLPIYKQIRAIEIRNTEFEKTSSRKIKRYSL